MFRITIFFLIFSVLISCNIAFAVDDNVNIRLMAIKHSKEFMADGDANLAINAVNSAASKGLRIKTIDNEFVGKNGILQVAEIDFNYKISEFKKYISEQMTTDAEDGDLLIIFTIGHGFENGTLQNLGARKDVMKAIAEAAQEHNQKVLWWQLSCHATAGLPNISSLTQEQQGLLSVLSSSTASEVSAAYVQGNIMKEVFLALAANNEKINPDKNDVVTGVEFKTFLNQVAGNNRGNLLRMQNLNEPIFGSGISLANKIPIVDRNGSQKQYPKDYIPRPR